MAGYTLIPISPYPSRGLVSLGRPNPALLGPSQIQAGANHGKSIVQSGVLAMQLLVQWVLHPWVQFPPGFQGSGCCSHTRMRFWAQQQDQEVLRAMCGGRICPSTAPPSHPLHGKGISRDMGEHWGSLGTQHPAGLGDGVGDGATTVPWAQLHRGYKGLMASISPLGDPHGGGYLVITPHLQDGVLLVGDLSPGSSDLDPGMPPKAPCGSYVRMLNWQWCLVPLGHQFGVASSPSSPQLL